LLKLVVFVAPAVSRFSRLKLLQNLMGAGCAGGATISCERRLSPLLLCTIKLAPSAH
jgi:hypothetical protein